MARRRRAPPKPETEPPEELDAAQWNSLRSWAALREPWALPELEHLVAQCLDHHRAVGTVRVEWVATCRMWVRNERIWRRKGGGDGISGRRSTPRGVAGAARAVAEQLGLGLDLEPGDAAAGLAPALDVFATRERR